jgi:methyl-accepting chemotaxis protein
MHFNLGQKLGGLIAVLVVLALCLFGVAFSQLRLENQRTSDIDAQWRFALQAQLLAQSIDQAVITGMEIYVAGDGSGAKPAYLDLETALDKVKRLKTAFLAELTRQGDTDGARQLGLRLDDFLSYQADTAELGLKMSPRAALIQATDEATVKNRDDTLVRINKVSKILQDRMNQERSELVALHTRGEYSLFGLCAILVVVAIGAAAWVARTQIQGPLEQLRRTLKSVADGQLDSPLPYTARRDEIGDMALAIQTVQDALRAKRDTDRMTRLRLQQEAARAEIIVKITRDFEAEASSAMLALSHSMTEMAATADEAAQAAESTKATSGDVLRAARSTATVLARIANAGDELATSAQTIERRVEHTGQLSADMVAEADAAHSQVQALTIASHKIGEAATLINGIASQTNLLALNATIEAARAGEAGRGFAIVASEVKLLADHTARATATIASQIDAIQGATQGTVGAIGSILAQIREINRAAADVTSATTTQRHSSEEIAAALACVKTEADVVSHGAGEVQNVAALDFQRSGRLKDRTALHKAQTTSLHTAIERFIGEVRGV